MYWRSSDGVDGASTMGLEEDDDDMTSYRSAVLGCEERQSCK